ncbi:hypothetical protein TNCV_3075961, partial [Trichonephila clavipes]
LTMKHATPLAFSHPRAKRVCFDKDNGKASSFKPDAVILFDQPASLRPIIRPLSKSVSCFVLPPVTS